MSFAEKSSPVIDKQVIILETKKNKLSLKTNAYADKQLSGLG
jgi:hypothetical protein